MKRRGLFKKLLAGAVALVTGREVVDAAEEPRTIGIHVWTDDGPSRLTTRAKDYATVGVHIGRLIVNTQVHRCAHGHHVEVGRWVYWRGADASGVHGRSTWCPFHCFMVDANGVAEPLNSPGCPKCREQRESQCTPPNDHRAALSCGGS